MEISFDGAARGNGSTNVKSACAVFAFSYECEFSKGKLLNCKTNNAAELSGAIMGLETVHSIVHLHEQYDASSTLPRFRLRGDSSYVISGILSGRALTYKKNDSFPNSSLWCSLAKLILELPPQVKIEYAWVPRNLNVEADEMCNAALDARRVNADIVSIPSPLSDTNLECILDKLLITMLEKRIRTIRTLPILCSRQLLTTISSLSTSLEFQVWRKLIFCLPRLISAHQTSVRNRHDFKLLLQHVTLLAEREYIIETASFLLLKQSDPRANDSSDPNNNKGQIPLAKAIDTLCSRGLFSKVMSLMNSSTYLADPKDPITQNRLTLLFPQSEIPPALPIGPPTTLTWGMLLRAFRKLKKGKSGGLTGWTREILTLFFNEGVSNGLKEKILTLFTCIANNTLSKEESTILATTILVPFGYIDAPNKTRPIQLGETFTKLVWLTVFDDVPSDPNLENTGWADHLKGASALAVACLQRCYEEGHQIVGADANNAFNRVSRTCAFKYLCEMSRIYQTLFPLLNLLYAQQTLTISYDALGNKVQTITVSQGTRQGCCSAPWFLKMCAIRAALKHKSHLVQIVDDVYIVGRHSLELTPSVFHDFALCGLQLDGKKLRIIDAYSATTHLCIPTIRAEPIPVHTGAIKVLGGLISLPTTPRNAILEALKDLLKKVDTRIDYVERLPATIQQKCLILKALSRFYIYHAQTIHTQFRADFFELIDEKHRNSFMKITGVIPNALHVPLINTHSEDGGIGLYPYSLVHNPLFSAVKNQTEPLLKRLSINAFPIVEDSVATCLTSNQQWRHIGTRIASVVRTSRSPISWMTSWPKNKYTRMDNETYKLGIALLLECLDIRGLPRCSKENKDLSVLPNEHVLVCSACNKGLYWSRHQKVLYALKSTLAFHDVFSTTMCSDLPLPFNTRGGPDLKVFAKHIDIVDVTIAFCRQKKGIGAAYARKVRTYSDFCRQTQLKFTPFVMSHTGVFHPKTIAAIQTWVNTKQGLADVVVNTQCALIEATAQAVAVMRGSTKLQSAVERCTVTALDEEMNFDECNEGEDDVEES